MPGRPESAVGETFATFRLVALRLLQHAVYLKAWRAVAGEWHRSGNERRWGRRYGRGAPGIGVSAERLERTLGALPAAVAFKTVEVDVVGLHDALDAALVREHQDRRVQVRRRVLFGDRDALDGGDGTPDLCDGVGASDTAAACEIILSVP